MKAIITFDDATNISAASITGVGATSVEVMSFGVAIAEIPEDRLGALRALPGVASVEPDGQVSIDEYAGLDVFSGFVPRPADESNPPYGITMVRAPQLHARGVFGAGVKVGSIDTGIELSHPDLAGLYVDGFNTFTNAADPWDDNRHGTHTIGTMAARIDGLGVFGVVPNISLYVVKSFSAAGGGSWSDQIIAVDKMIGWGVQICNCSWGGTGYSPGLEVAFNAARDAGMIMVCSAGNSGLAGLGYPAKFSKTNPYVVAVGAVDSSSNVPSFSSVGPEITIAAPGVAVLSTGLNGGWIILNGTSMAAPHVAGSCAAALEKGFTPGEVLERLYLTAVDLGNKGWDDHTGHGLVNAEALVFGDVTDPIPVIPRQAIFDASESSDPDGDPLTYSWDFGDGTTGSGLKFNKKFSADGDYPVSCTVTDPGGLSDTLERTYRVIGAKGAPQAHLTVTPAEGPVPLLVLLDATGTRPGDGNIIKYEMDPGDGNPPFDMPPGLKVSVNYIRPGTWPCKLTVVDDLGGVGEMVVPVTVNPPGNSNRPPTARFTVNGG